MANNSLNLLFIGSFMSIHSGSLCASEKLAGALRQNNIVSTLVSRKKNKIIRLIEIIIALFQSKAQCVHVDVYSGQAFIIAEVSSLICSLLKKKHILTLHGGALPEFFQNNQKRIKKVFNRANLILTPSQYLKHFFEDKGFKIQYIPNSIDLCDFPFDRSRIKPYSMLWVRAFDPIYNPRLAIETLFEVQKKYPEATLTMVGPDKGLLDAAKQLIKEKKLKNSVYTVGPVPNQELFSYYQSHEVFLNTTSYESFGVAVLEAASCGIPIVSTQVGEIPYMWKQGEEMLMVDDFEPEHFAEHVIKIFEDKELASLLSLNACKKAKTFDWEIIKPFWLNLFNNKHEG